MSTTPHRRPLGTGRNMPEPPPRDPRTLTAAERAVKSHWVELPVSTPTTRAGRRPLGTGPVDPGS
ncbi:hypothetical protein AB0L54_34340 [Streptomyces sp. NPDC052196]|uniref:hypothetical protein n=1 Tax=Streptomyces sp. NPDC052196 TaxID=3156691 RepID=UPI0034475044